MTVTSLAKREFHQQARTGRTRVWTVKVDGKLIHTSYGELGGKMQFVTDEGEWKNRGKKNEVTPEEDAEYLARRAVLKKTRNGYRPVGEKAPTHIVWEEGLPENFRIYKPSNTLSKTLEKLLEADKAWLGRKRDGEMMLVVKGPDGLCTIYSRTMLTGHHLEVGEYTWNDRFPHIVEEVERRDDIPICTIFLGDVVADPRDRDRWEVATFMKVLTPRALTLPPLLFYCWDVAFWHLTPVGQVLSTAARYGIIEELFGERWEGDSWFLPIEVWKPSEIGAAMQHEENPPKTLLEAAMRYAAGADWEGWVVVDPEKALGSKAFNFRGKTDRPSAASGKLKPSFEDDFIALFDPDEPPPSNFGKWGKGNNRGQVGSVTLYQHNSAGELVYICMCGGGIDDKFRADHSDPAGYPLVLQIEYTERTYKSDGDKTNALTFPRVLGVRTDKSTDECVNEKL